LNNHLWKWKKTVEATAYGNGRKLLRQPLMEMEKTVWVTSRQPFMETGITV
jgi:preprotein translocase subunit SecE